MLSPFRHLGSNSGAESLASGLTETLASALAHFEEFELIDPGSGCRQSRTLEPWMSEVDLARNSHWRVQCRLRFKKNASVFNLLKCLVDSGFDPTRSTAVSTMYLKLQDDITAFVASIMSDAVGEEQAKAISDRIPTLFFMSILCAVFNSSTGSIPKAMKLPGHISTQL